MGDVSESVEGSPEVFNLQESVLPVSADPKRKRTRRSGRKSRKNDASKVELECIVENMETVKIADVCSVSDNPSEFRTMNHAEPVVPKKKKSRGRKKKCPQAVSCDAVRLGCEAAPEMFLVEGGGGLPVLDQKPSSSDALKPRFKSISENGRNLTIPGMLFLSQRNELSEEVYQHSPCSFSSKENTCGGNETIPGMLFLKPLSESLKADIGPSTPDSGQRNPVSVPERMRGSPLLHKNREESGRQKRAKQKPIKPVTCFGSRKSEKQISQTSTEELSMKENRFEDHLQRELVDVMLKEQKFVIKGNLRINQRNYREAYVNDPDGGKDILIDGVKNRNRGLEGDEVVVQILPVSAWKSHEGQTQKTGKVIHILTPVHHRQAIGTLKKMSDNNSRNALFSPRDSRIPRMRVPIKGCPKNIKEWENQLFCARITDWDDVRYAKGQMVGESVGIQGDIEAETLAIMLENELDPKPYDPQLHRFFPTPPYHITTEDFIGREDLRHCCIFTIDPATAKDLDDAVSCEKLENGNFKVGVHISDVSHFLSEGTPLDIAVSKRATTTYLVQRVYHMLPRELTMMCSLLPGDDRLAFSVFWEITPDAEVVSHYFTRSVINSCVQLSYEHAQVMIEDPTHEWKNGELPKIHGQWCANDLKNVVCALHKLAVIMRKERFDGGALRVDQTKLVFHLDEFGMPSSLATYINKESHRLIEEFMLLANMTVATALQKRFPKIAFLRCHEEPQQDMMKRLAETLEKIGLFIDVSSAGDLHKSLQRYNTKDDDNAAARFLALNVLCSKPMTRARYFCAGAIGDVEYMSHYALNVPLYTHFTSPIRRYADVMVHRLLASLLGYSKEPIWTQDHVNQVASTCNKYKFCAKRAGEQSAELFLAAWIGQKGCLEEDAVVIDVKDHSFDALVCSTGTVVRVYTDKVPGGVDFLSSPVPQLRIVWSISGHTTQLISLFSVVRVGLRVSVVNSLKIEATLLPPPV